MKDTQVRARVARTVAPEIAAEPTAEEASGFLSDFFGTTITILFLAGIVFLLVYLDQLLLTQTTNPVWQAVYAAFLVFLGVLMFVVLWGRVMVRLRGGMEPMSFGERIAETFWMVAVPTAAFAALTALLVHRHWLLSASGSQKPGLTYVSGETYIWSLVDAIPFLNLTDAFNWHPQFQLLHESGRLFVLAFKLAIIVPLAYWLKTFISTEQ